MRSVGLAFAWDFWRRHCLVLWPVMGYLLVLVVLVNVFPHGTFPPETIAGLTIPLCCVVPLLTSLFSHGDKADLGSRESGYPRRLFNLPLRSVTLVGWPLAVGACTLVLFWVVLGGLVLRPAGAQVPLVWLAVFLVAVLAWVQALMWYPFPLPYLRLILTVLFVGAMIAVAILGFLYEVAPGLLLAIFTGMIPLGYLVAVVGVARARRGDVPVWHWPFLQRRQSTPVRARPFASVAEAFSWLEWKRGAFLLPLLVGLLVLPQLVFLYFVGDPRGAAMFLICLVIYTPVMAIAVGSSLGNTHPWSRQVHTMPAFIGARPITSGEILTFKLRAAASSTLATWAMILVAVMVVLPFSPARDILIGWARHLIDMQGVRGWAIMLLFVLGLPLLTWKSYVSQLWIGLTGRYLIVIAISMAIPIFILAPALFATWVYVHPEAHAALLAAAPWVIGLLLSLKLGAGVLVARVLLHRDLVTPWTMKRFALVWIIAATILIGLAYWLMPPDVYSPLVVGGLAVLVVLPLVRLGLAPLALEWNRHR
jgi:hypothetical protein